MNTNTSSTGIRKTQSKPFPLVLCPRSECRQGQHYTHPGQPAQYFIPSTTPRSIFSDLKMSSWPPELKRMGFPPSPVEKVSVSLGRAQSISNAMTEQQKDHYFT